MTLFDQSFDIASLHAAYRDGLSPQVIADLCFARAAAVDDPGIFIHLCDPAMVAEQVNELGVFDAAAKPLWGVPFAIKDNIDAAGLPTTAGCPAFAFTPDKNAFAVQRLRDAGAILIGKTNLDQFATGLVGVRTPFPIPRNALDPAIVPGGSSSGSAVAVGHGIVSFSLGTDTAGSGRVPAALNNIVGLKPSLGAVSSSGLVPACRSIDTISIFALTVDDAYTAFQAAAIYDDADSYSRPVPIPDLTELPSSFRIGIPDTGSIRFFGDKYQAQAFDDAVDSIEALGGTCVPIDFSPFYAVAEMLYGGVWVAERYSVIEDLLNTDEEQVHPTVRAVLAPTEGFSAVDTFRAFYKLQDLKRLVAPLIQSVDFFCVPTIPTFVTRAEIEADPIEPNSRLGTYTNFVNLLDLCGIAVPTKQRGDGRPGSVTILAPAMKDAAIASVARAIQSSRAIQSGSGTSLGARDWQIPQPKSRSAGPPEPTSTEIALCAVGAHMSGLPLNHQLTDRGARFLRRTRTANTYRLYALPGGPPARPGMIQVEDGAEINVEIWAMPAEHMGSFMAGIPSPLAIGTVHLADGTDVKGFLCEPLGVKAAEDVTHFGGWRAYLESLSTPPLKNPPPSLINPKENEHA